MFKQVLCVAAALVAVQATGDFVVLHSPDSVKFRGEQEVSQSLLHEIFCAALGYTPKQKVEWSGLSIVNPLELPEAVVGIAVEGVETIHSSSGKVFSLINDEVEESTWQALSGRLEERANSDTVRINLGDGVDALGHSAIGELKLATTDVSSLKKLSLDTKEDHKFLEEIQLLNAIAEKVRLTGNSDNKAEVYWFVLSALRPVLDLHGNTSAAAAEAISLLNKSLGQLSSAFIEVYKGRVMIAAFTSDDSHVRHTRAVNTESGRVESNVTAQSSNQVVESTTEAQLSQNTSEYNDKRPQISKGSDLNPSKAYDESYPVMFNIFLWFGVAFLFALIAICITIGDMDPGRDSIIYRMTSNRMKKDN